MKLPRDVYPILLLALTLSVAGCGRNNNDSAAVANPTPDAFVAAVQAIAATSPDDTEPVNIDAFMVTALDNVEPVQL